MEVTLGRRTHVGQEFGTAVLPKEIMIRSQIDLLVFLVVLSTEITQNGISRTGQYIGLQLEQPHAEYRNGCQY